MENSTTKSHEIWNQYGLTFVETANGIFNIETDDTRDKAWLRNNEGNVIESVEYCRLFTSKFNKLDAIRYLIEVAKK